MSDNPTPRNEKKDSFEQKKFSLEQRKFKVECATLFLLFMYTAVAGWNLQVARDTFNAANRPYVGVNEVDVAPVGKQPTGKPVMSGTKTKETNALVFRAQIKNFGPVPGTNFLARWRIFVAGVQRLGQKKVPDLPSTIFPSQSFYLKGGITGPDYPAIISGEKTLTIEVTVEYDGPSGHYKECNKNQYAPDINAFLNLGPMCTN